MKALLGWPLLSAALVLFVCLFIPPTYTATAVIDVRPSARQVDERGLVRTAPMPTAARYGALLQSRRVADRVIEAFDLQTVYDEPTLDETRERLARATRFGAVRGGLLVVQASDRYPWRAADLANQYAWELQRLLDELRVEDAHARADRLHAQARRVQQRLHEAHAQLAAAPLREAGLKLEPALMRKHYAGLQQALDASRRREAMLGATLHDEATELQLERARGEALHAQLRRLQAGDTSAADGALYADAAREVRLLEPLLQQLRVQAMQAEIDAGARVEALLGVDHAKPPERPSAPLALLYMALAWAGTLLWLLLRRWHHRGTAPWLRWGRWFR